MIMRETLFMLARGVTIGFPCVLAAGRLTSRFLFGLKPSSADNPGRDRKIAINI